MDAMKTYIFDYNGTIINDADIAVEIENEMLEERNLPAGYTLDDYRALFENDMIVYYRKIGYTFENESFEEIALQFNRRYEEKFEKCTLCDGVLELLEQIREDGDQCVILSSCQNDILHRQCDAFGISRYFREIMGLGDYLAGSKTEIGRHWMIRSGVNPEDCVYFGDTLADYHTAKAMDIENIWLVASGHQSFERLKQVNDNTIHSLKEYVK